MPSVLPPEFVLVSWDYGTEDRAAIDAAIVAAIPNGAQEFTCCATAPATQADYHQILQALTAIDAQHPSFSFAIVWVNRTVDNAIHQGVRP